MHMPSSSWHCLLLGLMFAAILVAGGTPRAEASVTLVRRRSPGFPACFRGILLPTGGGARFRVRMTLRGGGGGGGGGREAERQGEEEEEEEGSSSRPGGEMGTPNPKRPRHAVETADKGEEVSKTPEDISEVVEGDGNFKGQDRREDEHEDEGGESEGGKEGKRRKQGRDSGQEEGKEEEGKEEEEEEEDREEDEQEEEDDDDEYADWVEDEGGIDNTMAGLKAAQEDIDRALSLLDQAAAETAIPKELDPETIKQKAAEDKSMEEIPADFLEQLEVLEKEGALGGGKEGTGEDDEPMSESAEASDQIAVDEINAENFGMGFLSNQKERVGRAKGELLQAVQEGDEAGIRKAIRRGAPVNAADPALFGWTPLHYAAERGDLACMRTLIALGANISASSDVGTTPLHIACQNEQEEAVELLVNNGTDISPRSEADYTPFLMSAGKGNVIIPRYLARVGASIDEVTYCGNTALHLAATQGHHHMVVGLLDMGLDPNALNEHNRSALHYAAIRDKHKAVLALLAAGADPSFQDEDGETFLHCAASTGSLTTLEVVIKNVSDELLWTLDNQNRTALERARTMGEGLCTSLLWERMGRPGGKIDVLPRPKTRQELDEEFMDELWKTYKAHRNESFLDGVNPADDVGLFVRAKRRLNGEPEKVIKEEDMFVIRKGVREYVMDKPEQRQLLLDREFKKEMKPLGNIGR